MSTEAQRRASKKWREKNKEKQRHYTYKGMCKQFILKHATEEELQEVITLAQSRLQELKKS